MFRGRGERSPRMPPSRWSGGEGLGGRNHPYRGPPDHRLGGGYGFRAPPGEFDRGFHGYIRDDHGGIFAKLFVGAVPRTATEEEIRPLFEEHGKVVEVAFIKDKRTGQQQNCCFVKYAAVEDAERAICALHNQYTLPGGSSPIQVRYADGERERLGNCNQSALKYKLFVASINKQATERDIEEIFTPYGRVEDILLLRDEMNQNRCCFVKLTNREMAEAAISALHGTYVMSGCDQPLIVRFADHKKPRPGEFRGGHTFGGHGFRPRFQGTPPPRHTHNYTEAVDGDMSSNTSHPISPQCFGPSSESQWNGRRQSAVGTTSSGPPSAISSMASTATIQLAMHPSFRIPCNWSEHTCPDGFNYYYNCITRESVWKKPREYADYERKQHDKTQQQQQQKPPDSPPHSHLHSPIQPIQASQLHRTQPPVQSVQ